ncbi:hypothetical protein ROZALSC1DRAFT_31207, partial [Rozella allomycis CSF55]
SNAFSSFNLGSRCIIVGIKEHETSPRSKGSFLVSPRIKGEKYEEETEDGTLNLFSDLDIYFPKDIDELDKQHFKVFGFDMGSMLEKVSDGSRKLGVKRLRLLSKFEIDLEELEDLDLELLLLTDRRDFPFIDLEDVESFKVDVELEAST